MSIKASLSQLSAVSFVVYINPFRTEKKLVVKVEWLDGLMNRFMDALHCYDSNFLLVLNFILQKPCQLK